MTSREIRYELAECLATTKCVKGRLEDTLDVIAMETMKERLEKLLEYFNPKAKQEIQN